MIETEEEWYRAQEALDNLVAQVVAERANVEATDLRLETLNEDRRKYKSSAKVTSRSGLGKTSTAKGYCPTCEQPIKDALLPQERQANPMSVEENIVFLEDQSKTFLEMREESRKILIAKDEKIVGLRKMVADLIAKVRDQERTLRSDGDTLRSSSASRSLRARRTGRDTARERVRSAIRKCSMSTSLIS